MSFNLGALAGVALNPLAAIGTAAGLAGDAMNLYGQREQRKWEEGMANTAYQRASADMQKAGLNPAMMWGKGGPADTPNVAPPEFSNPLDSISSVMGMAQTQRQLEQMDKQMALTDTQTAKTAFEAEEANMRARHLRLQLPRLGRDEERFDAELESLRADARNKQASARSTEWDTPQKELRGRFYHRLNLLDDDMNEMRDKLNKKMLEFFRSNNHGRNYSARELEENMNRR